MAQTNHEALGQGLKLYTDAMRELIRNRLAAAMPNNWWEQGVLRVLPRRQSDSLKLDRERNPGVHQAELLEPTHFRTIVARNRGVFEGDFPKFQAADSYLSAAVQARNDWAHPRSGDILADDAEYALNAMARLLAMAGLPEAEEVEAIRKRVLHIEDEPAPGPAPAPVAETPPVAAGALPYWWQVCEPREGFRDPGQVDEGLFAATLGGVFAGAAREEYRDPTLFLSHTYFTENLTQMTRDVVNRLSGGRRRRDRGADPVRRREDARPAHALPPHQYSGGRAYFAGRAGSAWGTERPRQRARARLRRSGSGRRHPRDEGGRCSGLDPLGRARPSGRPLEAGDGLRRERHRPGERAVPAGPGGSLPRASSWSTSSSVTS